MRVSVLMLMVTQLMGLAACTRSETKRDTTAAAVPVPAAAPVADDGQKLAVDGGTIWYKVSGSGGGTPVILLHGGPGFSSYYLKPLEALGDERKVVRYDQLGGGKSSGLTDTTKMTIAHFVAELDSLRSHLGYPRVHLVGHSWGTILGLEYYRAHPDRVASLTLASGALDIPQWERHARALLATLPDSMQRAVKRREAEQKFDAPDYQAAIENFYGRYVWLRPVKADLDSTMSQVNTSIYNYMQGPSEFTITGTLKGYDAKSFLPKVRVPTLFTVGAVDEADPMTIRRFASMVPGGKVVVIRNAAHITTWDNPEAMNSAVRAHLRAADSAAVRKVAMTQ
jgi:proline iminopeptidase